MSKGVTLIETIISLGILALGVLAAIGAFPAGMRMVDFNRAGNTALFLATSEIESSIGNGYYNLEEGIEVTDFGELENFEDYRIERRVSCFDIDQEECTEETGIRKVEVEVFTEGVSTQNVTLTTLISER